MGSPNRPTGLFGIHFLMYLFNQDEYVHLNLLTMTPAKLVLAII